VNDVDVRIGGQLIDCKIQYAVFRVFGFGCRVVFTSAAGDLALKKYTGLDMDVFIINTGCENNDIEIPGIGVTAMRQALLQGKAFIIELFDLAFENRFEVG